MFDHSLHHNHGLRAVVQGLGGVVIGAAAVLLATRLFARATAPREAVEAQPVMQPVAPATKRAGRARTKVAAKRAAKPKP